MLQQLLTYGDRDSVKLLEVIEADELTHVSSGLRWFKFVCAHARSSPDAEPKPLDPIPTFHSVVRANFRGSLLPPFNTQARTACGFTEEWSGSINKANATTTQWHCPRCAHSLLRWRR
jgi:uncharacterized ferritin-like protein (DUF455 family)